MKQIILTVLTIFSLSTMAHADDKTLESYVANFDYDSRIEMKANSKKLIDLLEDGKAVLVDIRFKEEPPATSRWRIDADRG